MESVLIVSAGEKATALIAGMFKGYSTPRITISKSSSEARRILSSAEFDLVIINAPLSDEYGQNLAEICVESTNASCLLSLSE